MPCRVPFTVPLANAGEQRWKGLTWGMMPLLAGALCAVTHHFFFNDPALDSLVALQVKKQSVVSRCKTGFTLGKE